MFIRSLLALFVLSASSLVLAQTTVLDGVYSSSQAQRGARHYSNICADCHEGGEPDAEPLFGQHFIDRWREAPLDFLYGFISTNMPGDDAGNLKEAVYLETLAFLLKENGYPSGKANLTAAATGTILLVGENGPQPLPVNSLVRVTGCLKADGGSVQLMQGPPISRVRTADETTPEELAESASEVAGDAIYTLNDSEKFNASGLSGKKVQAKGVLNSQEAGAATIKVLSLDATGVACG
jgi:hypothetical protein